MYRERVTWSVGALVVLFLPVLVVLALVLLPGSGERTAGLVVVGVIALLFLATFVAFAALTIAIDGRELAVGFPVYRRRVPLDDIAACRPIRYRWWQYGGYGIRKGRGGMMLNVAGDGGHAVELVRRSGGALRFSSRDPEAVCAAIRARRPGVGSA